MAEIWPPYSFGSPVGKIMLKRVKTSNIFAIACVQAVGHSFFQIYFVFSAWISGYDISPRYLFCRLGVIIKEVIAILRPGVKIMLKILTCNLKTIAFKNFI